MKLKNTVPACSCIQNFQTQFKNRSSILSRGGKLLEEKSLDLSVRNATQFGMKFFRDCIKDVNINKYFLQVFPRFKNFSSFAFNRLILIFLTLFVMRHDYPKEESEGRFNHATFSCKSYFIYSLLKYFFCSTFASPILIHSVNPQNVCTSILINFLGT